MSNRQVTRDVSDSVIAGAALADFYLNKLNRLIEAHDAGDNTEVVVNKGGYLIPLQIGDHWFLIDTAVHVDAVTDLDTGTLAAGTNYYVYACTDGSTLSFKISAASTYPSGFDAAHSRKIGGFHTLCVAAGTISGHTLTGFAVKDILPASIWDLRHRPRSNPEGMVYVTAIQKWVDIYLTSGTGGSTASAYGATISDTRDWNDFCDDYAAVGKRLLSDHEFQAAAAGSNEETNITASADPVTTGGHVDTGSRRMISNWGLEDCCGALWQWLIDQSSMYSAAGAGYYDLPGAKGSLYRPANTEDVKLLAGGAWSDGATCGSRARGAYYSRWNAHSVIGGRALSDPL
jgi:hypothetical protein